MVKPFNYIEIIKDLLKILAGQMKGKLLLKQFFKTYLLSIADHQCLF